MVLVESTEALWYDLEALTTIFLQTSHALRPCARPRALELQGRARLGRTPLQQKPATNWGVRPFRGVRSFLGRACRASAPDPEFFSPVYRSIGAGIQVRDFLEIFIIFEHEYLIHFTRIIFQEYHLWHIISQLKFNCFKKFP